MNVKQLLGTRGGKLGLLSLVTTFWLIHGLLLEPSPGPAPAPAPQSALHRDLLQILSRIELTPDEGRYKTLAYTDDPEEALRLARQHRRPILAIYNDGPLGRC